MKQVDFRKWTEDFVGQARVYNWIQRTVGSSTIWVQLREQLNQDLGNFETTDTWVDLGCGTAEFLDGICKSLDGLQIPL